jgi:ubiquinone/menaquinone biosynthesis C-methylase UbiE
MGKMKNIDAKTVHGFGDEWSRYDQSALSGEERNRLFETYFHIFPKDLLNHEAVGFDAGCGSGRWAMEIAPRTKILHCIDASQDALAVAKKNLKDFANCNFYHASAENMPIPDASMDFGYSLGVLHHIPDTLGGLKGCTKKLKPGAPFLLYLYYRFDNRPIWYVLIWRCTDLLRRIISSLPMSLRSFVCKCIALFVYFPLARTANLLRGLGLNVKNFPLSSYRNTSFYTMQTDALDRFGTRLEKRYTKSEMKAMMEESGLEKIHFSSHMPHWCAVGFKK